MQVYSIIREEEYKRLQGLTLDGVILDLGGNIKSEYHALIKGSHTFKSVNIDPAHGCDMVFDIQKPFPLESKSFDAVISMNVFEHIFDFQNAFSESARVLKSGGMFVFAVPFMHHIHGCPDDYMRYTKSTLEQLLSSNGFGKMSVDEIGKGLFSFFYQSIAGVFPNFLKIIIKPICVGIDNLFCLSKRYRDLTERIPLGYFVVAVKK
jgi:SAM-dependent methyltransferase